MKFTKIKILLLSTAFYVMETKISFSYDDTIMDMVSNKFVDWLNDQDFCEAIHNNLFASFHDTVNNYQENAIDSKQFQEDSENLKEVALSLNDYFTIKSKKKDQDKPISQQNIDALLAKPSSGLEVVKFLKTTDPFELSIYSSQIRSLLSEDKNNVDHIFSLINGAKESMEEMQDSTSSSSSSENAVTVIKSSEYCGKKSSDDSSSSSSAEGLTQYKHSIAIRALINHERHNLEQEVRDNLGLDVDITNWNNVSEGSRNEYRKLTAFVNTLPFHPNSGLQLKHI